MAKGNKKRHRNGDGGGWSATDHMIQAEKRKRKNEKTVELRQQQKQQPERNALQNNNKAKPKLERVDRTSLLTHNTQEKRDLARLQLNITKVQRQINELKQRLTNWDPVLEAKRKDDKKKKEEEQLLMKNEDNQSKKKRGRLGPESWKLRGAARPAWEVYDFDTRYVDPYVKQHEDAAASNARSQNLLRIKISTNTTTNSTESNATKQEAYLLHSVAPEEAREYLGLLMQLGFLCQEANQYKTARASFLECIELEGDDTMGTLSTSDTIITSAREALMRMYLDLQRYDAAYRLGERLKLDSSCVVRFSMAIVAMKLQKDENIITNLLIQAVKSNIFATYYLCYFDTFSSAIEFTDDIADSDDEPQSTFEEALEYCSSKYVAIWHKTTGAIEKLKLVLYSTSITSSDREWEERLAKIESSFISRKSNVVASADDNEEVEEDVDNMKDGSDCEYGSSPYGLDLPMFANMFRTAMEMIQ